MRGTIGNNNNSVQSTMYVYSRVLGPTGKIRVAPERLLICHAEHVVRFLYNISLCSCGLWADHATTRNTNGGGTDSHVFTPLLSREGDWCITAVSVMYWILHTLYILESHDKFVYHYFIIQSILIWSRLVLIFIVYMNFC